MTPRELAEAIVSDPPPDAPNVVRLALAYLDGPPRCGTCLHHRQDEHGGWCGRPSVREFGCTTEGFCAWHEVRT
jgi:hypothetical protein